MKQHKAVKTNDAHKECKQKKYIMNVIVCQRV